MYCLNMLAIALELARDDPAYEDVASKFFEHFVYIADAMNDLAATASSCGTSRTASTTTCCTCPTDARSRSRCARWSGSSRSSPSRRSSPTCSTACPASSAGCSGSSTTGPSSASHVDDRHRPGGGVRRLLSIVTATQLPRVLRYMLDEDEFLSPHGIRALSRYHRDHPYVLRGRRRRAPRRLRAGRVAHRALRRQLELARAGLVPRQLPADRVAAEVPPLLRRRPQGRVSRPAPAG